MKKENFEQFLTVEQVAKILQVHWQTVLGFIHNNELPAMKLGRGYRISPEDLQRLIEQKSRRK